MSTTPIAFNLTQAAESVGLSERTIADAIRRGDLVAHYPTKRPQIFPEDLRAWVESAPTERAS